MRRRVFSFTAAASLLVCVATAAASISARFVSLGGVYATIPFTSRSVVVTAQSRRVSLWLAAKGAEGFGWGRNFGDCIGDSTFGSAGQYWVGYDARELAGLTWTDWQSTDNSATELSAPYWWVGGSACLLPALWLVMQSPRIRKGHCRSCGYSLTGNTSGTCPECGTPIPQPSRPA